MENEENNIAEEDSEVEENNSSNVLEDNNSVRHVNQVAFEVFRSKLVEHFNILFEIKKIAWPK